MPENERDLLESWKEIAGFIGRDEHTAMRWAKEQGMPVRRTPGSKRGRVYASREEISLWLQTPTGHEPAIVAPEATRTTKHRWLIASIAGVCVGFVALLIFSSLTKGRRLPTRVVFTENSIQAFDSRGHKLWEHSFERTFDKSLLSGPLESFVRFVDVKNAAGREVLILAPFRTGPNPNDEFEMAVDCFSAQGALLWSYTPRQTLQFGTHTLSGPWIIFDLFVSIQGAKPSIWVAAAHHLWGNSVVVQLDPTTGRDALRFVNTGTVLKLNELKVRRGIYMLVAGFNNEYDSGSLAVLDERQAFAASPQTDGTRHKCVSCAEGTPDYYFVFPRSELNLVRRVYEDPVRTVDIYGNEFEASEYAFRRLEGVRAIYLFSVEPTIRPMSLRFDSNYDQLHKDLSASKEIGHSLENCPERLHPKPVRMWTPAAGWVELNLPASRASD